MFSRHNYGPPYTKSKYVTAPTERTLNYTTLEKQKHDLITYNSVCVCMCDA